MSVVLNGINCDDLNDDSIIENRIFFHSVAPIPYYLDPKQCGKVDIYKLINERIEKLEEHIKKLEEKLNDPDHYYKLIAIIKIQRWWRYMKEAKKQWNKHLLVVKSL
jgi:hypothetical protein